MIKITETTDKNIIESVYLNPLVSATTYGQSNEKFKIDSSYKYLHITEDNKTLGIFQIREFTKVTVEGHVAILPEYWKLRTIEIIKAGHNYLKESGYINVVTSAPSNYIKVIKFLHKLKYISCGMIEKGIVFHGYLVTLFLFTYDLTKEV